MTILYYFLDSKIVWAFAVQITSWQAFVKYTLELWTMHLLGTLLKLYVDILLVLSHLRTRENKHPITSFSFSFLFSVEVL